MRVLESENLKKWHTFGLHAEAKVIFVVEDVADIPIIIRELDEEFILLGEGSNTVFLSDTERPIVHISNKGIAKLSENEEEVLLEVSAGENWHNLVEYCVNRGYYGIENLALIPGTVGAAPVQNIGAYGAEVSDVLVSVTGYEIIADEFTTLHNHECRFGYRDSIFKNALKDKFIIAKVVFRLSKGHYQPNLTYRTLSDHFAGIEDVPSAAQVMDAVIHIRQSKLPDPRVIGNAGSFFKNSIVSAEKFEQLKREHPTIPYYSMEGNRYKIPTGWLIEQMGWKGRKIGEVGVYHLQALVLINHGNGTPQELRTLIRELQSEVFNMFGITIKPEVNLIEDLYHSR